MDSSKRFTLFGLTVKSAHHSAFQSMKSMGISMERFCLDGDASLEATIQAMEKIGDVDGVNMMVGGLFPSLLTMAWLSKVKIPGRDLPPDVMWQDSPPCVAVRRKFPSRPFAAPVP
jgi:hypothetical protein